MSGFSAEIKADIGNFTKNIDKAGKEMGDFTKKVEKGGANVGTSLKQAGSEMGALGNAAKKAGAVIASAFAFTAVIRGLRSFISTNVDFEQSLANLSALTGAVGDDLNYYKKQAIGMGAVTTLTASQVSEAFMLIGSAQPQLLKSKEALAQVTKEAITLAEAAGMQLPDAARALTGAMNQFKISADSASEVINVLAAGSKEGSADINSLNQSLTNVGTVAYSAGLSINQTVGALETLAENQIKGAEAGTALRGVIMKLQASGLGYESGVFNLSDALKAANASIESHTTAVEKDARSQEIFGIINTTAGKILMQNVDTYHRLTDAVTGTSTAYEQQATNINTLSASFLAFKSAIEGIVLSFSESNGMIKSVVDSLVDMLNNIRENIEVYKRFGKVILSIGATFATATIAMKAFTIATTAMRIATVILAGKFSLLNAVMMVNPFVAVAAAVIGLTVYLVDLWKTSETFRAKFKYATEMVAYYFQVAWINIKKGAELWWIGIQAYFTAIPKLAQAAGKAIKAIFSGGNFADTFKEELNQHFENVKQNAKDVKEKYNEELGNIKMPEYYKILAKEVGVTVDNKESGKYSKDTDANVVVTDDLTKAIGEQGEAIERASVYYANLSKEATKLSTSLAGVTANFGGERIGNFNIGGNDLSFDITPEIKIDTTGLSEKMMSMRDTIFTNLRALKEEAQTLTLDLGDMLSGGISNAMQGLGNALANGDNMMGALGGAIISTLGNLAQQVGAMMITFGVGAMKLKLMLANPLATIAAGAALVALGSLAVATVGNAMNSGIGGGGYSGGGGYNSTRVDAPMQQGEFDMRQSYQGGQSVEFKISGDNLVGVLDRKETKRNRNL